MAQSSTSSMILRVMTRADIPAGMRLKEIAGWNQTPADWERFLLANPEGCFAADVEGQVVGTVTSIIYGGLLGWIGMVLVDPKYRGQGIGTRLLARALESLDGRRLPTVKLDATPQGKAIYEKFGFVPEYGIERWILKRSPSAIVPPAPAAGAELEEILALDQRVFGTDRRGLLCSVHGEAPALTSAVRRQAALAGYAFGRHGSRADHLGPWMAEDETVAGELLDEFLRRSARETVFVDCLNSNPFVGRLLRFENFEFSRPLTRMVRGPNVYPGEPRLLCAILGPEYG